MLFRTRDLLVRQRTQTINALRGHLAEFGLIASKGAARIDRLVQAVEDDSLRMPDGVRDLVRLLIEQIATLTAKIATMEKDIR